MYKIYTVESLRTFGFADQAEDLVPEAMKGLSWDKVGSQA